MDEFQRRIVSQEEQRGKLITRLRKQRLWTREQLAKEAGVSTTTVSGAEEGHTRIRFGTIKKLAEALGVEPQLLLYPESEARDPKAAASSSPIAPEEDVDEERRMRAVDMVYELVSRQIEEDRQMFARGKESARIQDSFVRHENEARNRLLEYPREEVDELCVDLMRLGLEQYPDAVQERFQTGRDKGTATPSKTRAQGVLAE